MSPLLKLTLKINCKNIFIIKNRSIILKDNKWIYKQNIMSIYPFSFCIFVWNHSITVLSCIKVIIWTKSIWNIWRYSTNAVLSMNYVSCRKAEQLSNRFLRVREEKQIWISSLILLSLTTCHDVLFISREIFPKCEIN